MPGVAAGAGLLDPFSDPVAGVAAAPSAAGAGAATGVLPLVGVAASGALQVAGYGVMGSRVVDAGVCGFVSRDPLLAVPGAIGGVRGITPEMYLQTLPLARTLLGSQTISRPLRMRSLKGL